MPNKYFVTAAHLAFLFVFFNLNFAQIKNNKPLYISNDILTQMELQNQNVQLDNFINKGFNLSSDSTKFSANKRLANFLIGLGYYPFEFNSAIGYFLSEKEEINFQYNSMFIPLSLDVNAFSVGMRFYQNKSSTVYSVSLGITTPIKQLSPIEGICLKGNIGYLMENDLGFYFMPSLKAGIITRKHLSSVWIIGLDISIGWVIK